MGDKNRTTAPQHAYGVTIGTRAPWPVVEDCASYTLVCHGVTKCKCQPMCLPCMESETMVGKVVWQLEGHIPCDIIALCLWMHC